MRHNDIVNMINGLQNGFGKDDDQRRVLIDFLSVLRYALNVKNNEKLFNESVTNKGLQEGAQLWGDINHNPLWEMFLSNHNLVKSVDDSMWSESGINILKQTVRNLADVAIDNVAHDKKHVQAQKTSDGFTISDDLFLKAFTGYRSSVRFYQSHDEIQYYDRAKLKDLSFDRFPKGITYAELHRAAYDMQFNVGSLIGQAEQDGRSFQGYESYNGDGNDETQPIDFNENPNISDEIQEDPLVSSRLNDKEIKEIDDLFSDSNEVDPNKKDPNFVPPKTLTKADLPDFDKPLSGSSKNPFGPDVDLNQVKDASRPFNPMDSFKPDISKGPNPFSNDNKGKNTGKDIGSKFNPDQPF